jgi:hypothetical protein
VLDTAFSDGTQAAKKQQLFLLPKKMVSKHIPHYIKMLLDN